ncbi:MAG: hypothetical protein HYT50_01200 [Candidatus Wildermuthbacteria bacterium]|nr:hypothetical protein [Candidatus Wildermuthbacteria bacterium]
MFVLLLVEYAKWHFFIMPLEILKAWRNIVVFSLNYFSLPLLLQTLFSPWRRIEWKGTGKFDPGMFAQNMFGNLISRVIGASIRIWVIALGILGLFAALAGGAAVFVAWIIMPLAIFLFFVYGLFLFL